jgi:hypothetical protein
MSAAMRSDIEETVRRYYRAYETDDVDVIEELLTDDFSFTSPQDDHIDRARYLSKCWPGHENIRAFHIERIFERPDEALVMYQCEPISDPPFRNVEFLRFQKGQIKEVVVYFGAPVGSA